MLDGMSLSAFVNEFIGSRGSPDTRASYQHDWEAWEDHAGKNGIDIESPTLSQATAYRDHLLSELGQRSVRKILATLASIYNRAKANRLVEENPFDAKVLTHPPKSRHNATEMASRDDVLRMLAWLRERVSRDRVALRDVAMVLVLWETGIRRVSLVGMRRAALIEREGVYVCKDVPNKGAERIEIEITASTKQAIDDWLAFAPESPWIFCTPDGKKISRSVVTNVVRRAAAAVGVQLRPHMFRVSFITHVLDSGMSLRQAQLAAGHADASSTAGYDRGQRVTGVVNALARFRAQKR